MKRRELASVLWTSVSFAFLLVALVLAAALLVIPKATDALPLTILTGSMRPAMEPGTLVVVRPTDPSALKAGDVVTYQWKSGEPTLVTHRIIEIRRSSNGETTLITQGDNNDAADPPVQVDQVMGKVIYAIPYFGWVSNNVNSEAGREYTRWAAYGFVAYGAWSFLCGVVSALRGGARQRHRRPIGGRAVLAHVALRRPAEPPKRALRPPAAA